MLSGCPRWKSALSCPNPKRPTCTGAKFKVISFYLFSFHFMLPFRNHQFSLTSIHQTLLRGAVPDRPTGYINRPQTIIKLTDGFRWLGAKFHPPPAHARQEGLLDNGTTLQPDIPTNAWFLVYGPPGQGKSVTTAAILRQNHQLLAELFSGGEWMNHVVLTMFHSRPTQISMLDFDFNFFWTFQSSWIFVVLIIWLFDRHRYLSSYGYEKHIRHSMCC